MKLRGPGKKLEIQGHITDIKLSAFTKAKIRFFCVDTFSIPPDIIYNADIDSGIVIIVDRDSKYLAVL